MTLAKSSGPGDDDEHCACERLWHRFCALVCVGTWLKPSSVAALSLCAAHGFEVICFCSLSVNTLACYFALLLRTTCVEACVKGLIRVAVACLGCGRHTSCEGRLAAGRRRDTRMNMYGYVRRTLKGLERETRVARCVRTVHARAVFAKVCERKARVACACERKVRGRGNARMTAHAWRFALRSGCTDAVLPRHLRTMAARGRVGIPSASVAFERVYVQDV